MILDLQYISIPFLKLVATVALIFGFCESNTSSAWQGITILRNGNRNASVHCTKKNRKTQERKQVLRKFQLNTSQLTIFTNDANYFVVEINTEKSRDDFSLDDLIKNFQENWSLKIINGETLENCTISSV